MIPGPLWTTLHSALPINKEPYLFTTTENWDELPVIGLLKKMGMKVLFRSLKTSSGSMTKSEMSGLSAMSNAADVSTKVSAREDEKGPEVEKTKELVFVPITRCNTKARVRPKARQNDQKAGTRNTFQPAGRKAKGSRRLSPSLGKDTNGNAKP